jgi:hypothetical protein
MSVSNITAVQRNTSLPNVERLNRINANNRKISALESQIAGQKEVSAAAKELIANNSKSINLTKEIITDTKKLIDIKKEMISNNEALISSGNRKIDILEQLKASNDRLIGIHQEQRGLLQETRDLLQESRDLTKESRDLLQKMIDIGERMVTIMMKNPARYGGLPSQEVQQLPEMMVAKKEAVATVAPLIEQYPQTEHSTLTKTVNGVVEASFLEIDPKDLATNRKLFHTLGKRVEVALDKKHELLALDSKEKSTKKALVSYNGFLENFSRIKRLAYLELNIKNIKI